MDPIPEMWRVELLHPLVVHLPIGLLLSGVAAWLASAVVDAEGRWGFLRPAARLALVVGTASAWVAVYTGGLADAEVVRTLCDPTVVEEHENLAMVTSIVFTSAVVIDLVVLYLRDRHLRGRRRLRLALMSIVGVGLIVGASLLGYVGHLGSKLVYQQGAAVYQPSEMCTEFE